MKVLRFWNPHQFSSLGIRERVKESPGNLALSASDLIKGLSEDWGKHRLQSLREQTKFCRHQDPEERSSDLTGDWNSLVWLPVLEGLQWRYGWQGLTTGMEALPVFRSQEIPLGLNLLGIFHGAYHRLQGWITSGQKTTMEGAATSPISR